MHKIEFILDKQKELIKAIIDELPFLSRFDVKKILDSKDVKVNNQRIKDNIKLNIGDKVVVFYQEKSTQDWYTLVYSDDNILIVNKRAGIEVISDSERDLLSVLKKDFVEVFAVHRLDRNTEGLVVFARNQKAKAELETMFKSRKGIIKKYALLVEGRVDIEKIKRTVYLKKVDSLSKVWISEVKTSDYEPIVTEFDLIKYLGNRTLLEANLITGKTHQIRAHIAYFGYPIVGDGKYGKAKDEKLHLTACYLGFNFAKKSDLCYLNGKNFEIIPTWL